MNRLEKLARHLYFTYCQRMYLYRYYKRFPRVKYELKNNTILKDKYIGKRCFILGNGPSLDNVDFDCLKNEITFSVNQLPRNEQFHKLKTNFHIWSDERFFNIDQTKQEDVELLNVMRGVNTTDNKPLVLYEYRAKEMVEKFKLDEVLNIRYYAQGRRFNPLFDMRKKIDLCSLIPDFPSVVQGAICIAIYMGFSEIYLLGCDCTGFLGPVEEKLGKNGNRYCYKISENEKKRMDGIDSYRIKNLLRSSVEIIDKYEYILEFCHLNCVKLFNCTDCSLIENIPYIPLESVLKKCKTPD